MITSLTSIKPASSGLVTLRLAVCSNVVKAIPPSGLNDKTARPERTYSIRRFPQFSAFLFHRENTASKCHAARTREPGHHCHTAYGRPQNKVQGAFGLHREI